MKLVEDLPPLADEDQDALFQGDGLLGDSVEGVLGDRLAGLQVGGGGVEGARVSRVGHRRPEDGAQVFVVLDRVSAETGLGLYPARLRQEPDGDRVEPLAWQGSADLRTIAEADALVLFPAGTRRYTPDELLTVLMLARP